MTEDKKFNLRVYGLLVWNNRVLVSDEWLWDKPVTKFPGGGLEWGEGLSDGLRREFREEASVNIHPGELFYVNDFFQASAYNSRHQIISFYYRISVLNPESLPVKEQRFDFTLKTHGEIVFRWQEIEKLEPGDFYFPIDKTVAEHLRKRT